MGQGGTSGPARTSNVLGSGQIIFYASDYHNRRNAFLSISTGLHGVIMLLENRTITAGDKPPRWYYTIMKQS